MLHIGDKELSHDGIVILSLVEEDGELKIIQGKNFADAEEYRALKAVLAEGAPVS